MTRTPSVAQTPRQSFSISSLNGNTFVVPCPCPGCPGNPETVSDPIYDDENRNIAATGKEDYLDTLDRKVNEIMNRDCSRRSSQQDLTNKCEIDVYGPLDYGRNKPFSDLNSNPTFLSPRIPHPPAPEGTIKFEDDDKESSSDGMNSSREDLTHIWSDDDDRERMILRRQRYVPLPRPV